MIVIQQPEYSVLGNIAMHETADSKLQDTSRRVTRKATIDGGVHIDDLGFSHGDRTFEIRVVNSVDLERKIDLLMQNFTLYHCLTLDGIFSGVIQRKTVQDNIMTITFLVKEKRG